MADYVSTYPDTRQRGASWSAIFAGTFVFVAIMSTFEALGLAIFGGSVPGAMSTGLAVWTAVLGVISLSVAGRAAGRLSYSDDKGHASYIGLVTFGMSVFSAILVVAMIAAALGAYSAGINPHNAAYPAGGIGLGGYATFCGLVVGLLGCVWGARSEVRPIAAPNATVEQAPNVRRIA